MNATRTTSLEALADIRAGLSRRQARVLEVIDHFAVSGAPASDLDIADVLRWPINCVTPRRGELVKLGLVEDAGQYRLRDGRNRHYWIPALRLFAGEEVR